NPRPSDYKSDALPTELRRPGSESRRLWSGVRESNPCKSAWKADARPLGQPRPLLLGLLLFLLADANLEVQNLGFLERLVIVARHGIGKVLVYIGVLRE